MVVPPENVGAVTTLARRFCEEMKTRGYDYSSSQGGKIQLLVQSGQLHRLMSALQSLDTGVTMRLTMKVHRDDPSISILDSNIANHSFLRARKTKVMLMISFTRLLFCGIAIRNHSQPTRPPQIF